MKTIVKLVCLAYVGIGMCSCSNEDVVQPEVDAPVAVGEHAALTIRIENPGLDKRSDGSITSDGKITISELTVKYIPGGTMVTKDITDSSQPVVLYDVPKGTTGLAVVGNSITGKGTDAAFSSTSDAETNTKDKGTQNATVYGLTTTLTPSGSIQQDDVTYMNYEAKVTMKAVTARMELTGLQFEPKSEGSAFSSLTLEGVFLNMYNNKGEYATSGAASITVSDPKGISASPKIENPAKPEENPAFADVLLADWFKGEADENGLVFYKADGANDDEKRPVLPDKEKQKAWTYNFFVNTAGGEYDLPKFTVVLNPTYVSEPGFGKPLYAVVSKYTDSKTKSEITSFEAGKIYKVTELVLPEDKLTPDIDGSHGSSITAIITVEDWDMVTTDIDWK